jgi:hypothetical protein
MRINLMSTIHVWYLQVRDEHALLEKDTGYEVWVNPVPKTVLVCRSTTGSKTFAIATNLVRANK